MRVPIYTMPDGDDGYVAVIKTLNGIEDDADILLAVLGETDIEQYIRGILKRCKRASVVSKKRSRDPDGWVIVVRMSSVASTN